MLLEKLIDRTINATIVLAAGTFAVTKLLTIDSDYWHVSQNAQRRSMLILSSIEFVLFSENIVNGFFLTFY